MTSSLLLVVVFSTFSLGSAADECTGGDRSSVLVVPSSGPTVCLPLDDYIQLQKDAASDGESVSYYRRFIRLKFSIYLALNSDECSSSNVRCVINPGRYHIHIDKLTLTVCNGVFQ